MKCPKCKADISEDSHFCSKCGTSLKPSKEVSVTKTLQKPAKGFKKDTIIAKKYRIIGKIGEGGMGIVYKARDIRLDRTVGLKFLPPDLTSDKEAKGRFIQEAKAAAALNHPHICTIYEIDEADNQTFISMEYIKGQSLKDKLKEGPLSIDEAKDIALQVAAGLDKAHKKGIVHRDIKPANIMINDEGQAKITDFGLAKLSWGADLTKPSTIMGTVAYMSPEQARGEEVDHRTDIWSLGAMLYEMLSGERPFQKAQDQALIYAILNDKPTPISLIRSDIPDHAEHLIERALVKKADD
jgi:serine/threonine protein kinase